MPEKKIRCYGLARRLQRCDILNIWEVEFWIIILFCSHTEVVNMMLTMCWHWPGPNIPHRSIPLMVVSIPLVACLQPAQTPLTPSVVLTFRRVNIVYLVNHSVPHTWTCFWIYFWNKVTLRLTVKLVRCELHHSVFLYIGSFLITWNL